MSDRDDFAVVVGTENEPSSPADGATRPRSLIWVILAAALLLIAIVTTTRRGGISSNSDEILMDRIAVWETTFNQGDVVGHLALFNESSVVGGQILKLADGFEADLAWEFGWNPQMKLSSCQMTQARVSSCRFFKTDDFLGPIGLTERGVVEFALDPEDGRLARVDFRADGPEQDAIEQFFDEFYLWVAAHHPEVTLIGQTASRDRQTWVAMRDEYVATR